jgi:hypothetical protein
MMKFATLTLVSVLALTSLLIVAQTGSSAGAEATGKTGALKGTPANGPKTTGNSMGSQRSSGSATGSGAPQDKPNLSNSPETSDTSQKVK